MRDKYHKVEVDRYGPGSLEVMDWQNGIVFFCPCDGRRVYITSPPHTVLFDAEGVLTLEPSIGSHENESHPQNWCHFWLKDGKVEMCADTKCPGANL